MRPWQALTMQPHPLIRGLFLVCLRPLLLGPHPRREPLGTGRSVRTQGTTWLSPQEWRGGAGSLDMVLWKDSDRL